MAPETLEGKPIDHRVDIFSLGIVLHEMLTLRSLFESDNQALTFRKILELPIAPPSASRPAIPPELDAIVMKALERDPQQRYATASAMADDLNRFLADNGLRMDHIASFVRGLHERTVKAESQRTSPVHPQPPRPLRPPRHSRSHRNGRKRGLGSWAGVWGASCSAGPGLPAASKDDEWVHAPIRQST